MTPPSLLAPGSLASRTSVQSNFVIDQIFYGNHCIMAEIPQRLRQALGFDVPEYIPVSFCRFPFVARDGIADDPVLREHIRKAVGRESAARQFKPQCIILTRA